MLKWITLALLLLTKASANETLQCASDFAFKAHGQMAEEDGVFSPFSLFSAFSMTHLGAAGKTEAEMARALSLFVSKEKLASDISDFLEKGSDFYIANSLFASRELSILPDFRAVLENSFRAEVRPVNFQKPYEASLLINEWVFHKTMGKIPELLQMGDLHQDTSLVLVNTIYFKGAFQKPFSPEMTKEGLFAGKAAPMMDQTAHFGYLETDDLQIAALPFTSAHGGKTALVIVLPKEEKPFPQPDRELFEEWMRNLRPAKLHIRMPKFSLRTTLDAKKLLKALGVETALTPAADFSGITGGRDLFISKAVHEACFDLDEAGVEAAAATAVIMNLTSTAIKEPMMPIEFIANRPFLFLLVDLKTETPLFIGRLSHAAGS